MMMVEPVERNGFVLLHIIAFSAASTLGHFEISSYYLAITTYSLKKKNIKSPYKICSLS